MLFDNIQLIVSVIVNGILYLLVTMTIPSIIKITIMGVHFYARKTK